MESIKSAEKLAKKAKILPVKRKFTPAHKSSEVVKNLLLAHKATA